MLANNPGNGAQIVASTMGCAIFGTTRRAGELHYAIRHPNIVEVFAYSIGSPTCMVMERMSRSLYECINSGMTLDFGTKMSLLVGIAEVSHVESLAVLGQTAGLELRSIFVMAKTAS